MNTIVFIKLLIVCIFSGFLLQGCIKQFDSPPAYSGTNLQANTSIRSLYDSHIAGNTEKFVDNEIITGIVTANDEKDNFYKSIVLQDSTAAITIRLDGFGLSAQFPLGMRIMVKLNGLWMGEYGGMLQIGGGVDRTDPMFAELLPVPAPLFSKHLLGVQLEAMPKPIDVTYHQLNDSLHSRLVRLNNIELAIADTAKSYGDPINKLTVSHSLKFCTGGTVYLRTSGFASFAAIKTPNGSGSIVGIYSEFGSQRQLMIRDTNDVLLTQNRCVGIGPSVLFYEDFEQAIPNSILNLPNWNNLSESGKLMYQVQTHQNNQFASISALGTNESALISWLVLPSIQLNQTVGEQLSFLSRDAFDNGANLQILVSNNYDGKGQPWKAKWTNLKANFSKGALGGLGPIWVKSGNISLSNLTGSVHLAFKYTGSDFGLAGSKKNTQFWVDDVKITTQ
ncbi:DUF5689 domain-containing protein [Sediminibacterium sp.]|uniref:DUF5689 domain-containing protein n=1 Tax=Sediminibacterium sp. TaxID=1917865 RepID=UPI003F72A3E3